jgi:NADH-quinone oxidoreductase subunit I
MPGNVIKVKRREKLGILERLYLPMIVEQVDYPDAFRGMPVLVQLPNGEPRCVACGLCEFACPTDCISIVPGEIEGARIERYPEAFEIDMARCMFCGLCEEACPEEAIVMSRETCSSAA